MKRVTSDVIVVDGAEYRWSVLREPQWCTADGWKGLTIMVEPTGKVTRSLIIEFPFARDSHRSVPWAQRPQARSKEIKQLIAKAQSSGWVPGSRGKAFVYRVEDHA